MSKMLSGNEKRNGGNARSIRVYRNLVPLATGRRPAPSYTVERGHAGSGTAL